MTLRILVVDDDFATRMLASAALTSDGFETVEATDGLEALARFDEQPPDAVLIDVNMPELDGYETCRRIRARATHGDTPVMIMTASDDVEAVRLAFAAGATDFLTKPLDLPLLGHRVRFMLRASAVAAEAVESARKIVGLAYYDQVTGLPNRQFVERHLAQLPAGEARTAIVVELGSHHLDRLPSTSRDELIRAAARRVIATIGDDLALDQPPHDPAQHTALTTVARISSDTLVVIGRFTSPLGDARRLADALVAPFPIGPHRHRLRPRIGVASSPDPVSDLPGLVDAAEYAVHRAEPTAPRNVVAFTEIVADQRGQHLALAADLAHALTLPGNPGLALAYVMRMSPATGELVGVRTTVEWADDEAPGLFAAVLARDPVLSDRLALWTLERATRDGARWLASGAAFRIAVEVPLSVFGTPADASSLADRVHQLGFRPDLIELELRAVPRDHHELDRAAAIVGALRTAGFGVALASLDGDTTLAQVHKLAPEMLRIDRSTIERHGSSLLAVLVPAARALGIRIAASGIDAPAALATLEDHVIDEISGALAGPPLTAEAVLGMAVPAFDTVTPGIPASA